MKQHKMHHKMHRNGLRGCARQSVVQEYYEEHPKEIKEIPVGSSELCALTEEQHKKWGQEHKEFI